MTTQPTRSYTRLAIAIVLAAVLISASIFVAVVGATKTFTETTTLIQSATVATTEILPQNCTDPGWSSTDSSQAGVPVLLMQPGSTAFICVTYQSPWQGNSTEYQGLSIANDTYEFSLDIGNEHCAPSEGGGGLLAR